ncbi:hypothetical protein BY996DRAFT_6460166 [Phakopsora pachyrhizi]|nr:hypothetical protein BY996DRAFT_6460166 [Phakopsora pachyrhizi]
MLVVNNRYQVHPEGVIVAFTTAFAAAENKLRIRSTSENHEIFPSALTHEEKHPLYVNIIEFESANASKHCLSSKILVLVVASLEKGQKQKGYPQEALQSTRKFLQVFEEEDFFLFGSMIFIVKDKCKTN